MSKHRIQRTVLKTLRRTGVHNDKLEVVGWASVPVILSMSILEAVLIHMVQG